MGLEDTDQPDIPQWLREQIPPDKKRELGNLSSFGMLVQFLSVVQYNPDTGKLENVEPLNNALRHAPHNGLGTFWVIFHDSDHRPFAKWPVDMNNAESD